MTKFPIPDAALDDSLGFTGTAGSGKTYNACSAVERILDRRGRVVIPDPLGVWWGLRLMPDGKTPSPYRMPIFGGSHGDLPLNEQVGALIGETVAGMAESCIIDLSDLGTKAAERRFMLAFLTAFYRHTTGEPVHIVFDEADMWSPQRLMDKDGDAARLLGMMETIVRRGRVKGFIPWLITQRPAVVSKDVLSQVDGLVSFKLTSSQDRAAIGAWIEGQADQQQGKAILASLPTMQRGQGVVWVPGRGILDTASFPLKKTFDSSRTPKRGEKKASASLAPLDLGALKERLSTVEAEAKENDPKALKAEIARLKRDMLRPATTAPITPNIASGISKDDLAARLAEARVDENARVSAAAEKVIAAAYASALHDGRIEFAKEILVNVQQLKALGIHDLAKAIDRLAVAVERAAGAAPKGRPAFTAPQIKAGVAQRPEPRSSKPETTGSTPAVRSNPKAPAEGLTVPQQLLLDALAGLESLGIAVSTRTQLALWADVSPTSGGYFNNLGRLRTAGLIDYPQGGTVKLTDAGRAVASPAESMTEAEMQEAVCRKVGSAKAAILRALIALYPHDTSRDELAQHIGVSNTSGGYFNNLGALRTLGLIDYPSPGRVAALPVLFIEGE